ncbi:MAG: hypothetical protein H6822_36175 [Planctomycetaceae bacterium]|nr:hypothetical protein [Planctomycetales bacterium]MCB9927627.1 hypothetical protein [Planctomycetaceae bacterium]
MDPLHLCIALSPLSVYLLLLGVINLSRRPLVTNGARDAAALGVAISGFVVVGPMELFVPEATILRLGVFVWALLLAFYAMCLTLFVLLMRPRLVIYNIRPDQVRPMLAELVNDLDRESRWAGECLIIPNLGVQLHVEASPGMRNVQLIAAGPHQSYDGWHRLEKTLSTSLRQVQSVRNPYGFSLVFFALLMIGSVTFWLVQDADTVAHSLREMLRL